MHKVLRRSLPTTSPILVRLCLCMKLHTLIYAAIYIYTGFEFIAYELIIVVVVVASPYFNESCD